MRILFLCTGNSCRSQMAEGWARVLHGDLFEAFSAGVEAKGIDPLAAKVMSEVGIDLSVQNSKNVSELGDTRFDVVVTVCDHAREVCPTFPRATRLMHAGFDDPPHLACNAAGEAETLEHYRRVRDEIRTFVAALPHALQDRGED